MGKRGYSGGGEGDLRGPGGDPPLEIVINNFDKFPLLTKKKGDLHALKLVIIIIKNKEHLTIDGIRKIVALKASMNRGLSDRLIVAFPDVVPVERPFVEIPKTLDPQWLAGFTCAEGSFMIKIQKYKTGIGYNVYLVFQLTQHARDMKLLICIKEYLRCGNINKNRETFDFRVIKFDDIANKIIPFYNKYPIKGVKAQDFKDFCRVAEIIKAKKHLTKEGLEQIQQIKAVMNRGRKLF